MILQPGDRVGGRFQVEALLGEGGTARVYRVRHLALGSQHALKLLDPEARVSPERLLLEGRIQATLRHPCVVPVTDVVDQDGSPGLVMEFVAGPSLADVLARRRLGVDEALAVFARILAGVNAAHAVGVLHRDLKPHNVLMAPMTGGWLPKVADFGIARSVVPTTDLRRTRIGVGIGTPGYMAPEQARGAADVDKRADIYALGVVLFELLTGDLPGGDRPGAPPPDPEAARARLGGGPVGEAVARALQADPAARFDDIAAMAATLYEGRASLRAVAVGEAAPSPVVIEGEPSEGLAGPAPSLPITGPAASPTMVAASYGGGGSETLVAPPPARRAPWFPLAVGAVAVLALLAIGGVGVWWWSTRGEVAAVEGGGSAVGLAPAGAPVAPPVPEPSTSAAPGPAPGGETVAAAPPTAPSVGPTATSPAPGASPGAATPLPGASSPAAASPAPTSAAMAPVASPPEAASPTPAAPTAAPATSPPTPAAPTAAPAVAEAAPSAERTAAPEAAALPDVRGSWHGTVGGRAVEVKITSQSGARVTAQVTLSVGATDRAFRYTGTVDTAGALSLMEDDGQGRLAGTVAGGRLVGTLATGSGKPLALTVTRE